MPWQNPVGGLFRPQQVVNANRTLIANDANTFIITTNATAITITVPTDATVPLPVGTEVDIAQDGAGAVTISGASGVTILRMGSTATTGHVLMGQYAIALLKKVGANNWRLYGGVSF